MSAVEGRLQTVAQVAHDVAQGLGRGALPRDVGRLVGLLTGRRRDRAADYMNDPGLLRAYVALYLPKNAARVALLLEKVRAEHHLRSLPEAPRVLDIGAGPLSGLIGAWAAFGALADCSALDRSRRALSAGQDVWAALPTGARVRTKACDLRDKQWPLPASAQYDLVLAANVLNELPPTGRARRVLGWLSHSGAEAMVLIEPGTRLMSRAVMALRDELVAGGAHVAAPCPVQNHCPLLDTRDWCHTALHHERPETVRKLERSARIKPGPLLLSYIVVTRAPAHPVGRRVVSGVLDGGQQQVCGPDGLVTMKLRGARRGDALRA